MQFLRYLRKQGCNSPFH